MKRLKKLWAHRPRLSRGGQILRNTIVFLICLYALWVQAGRPLPTAELEFRRLERKYLVEPSDIQGVFQSPAEMDVVMGTQADQVVLRYGPMLYFWPRQGAGATLFPVWERRALPEEVLFAAVDVPPGTASARLEAAVSCWWSGGHGSGFHISAREEGTPWSRSYQAEGELLDEGGVLFRLTAQEDRDSDDGFLEQNLFMSATSWYTYQQSDEVRAANIRAEAVFYDKAGAELGRAFLNTPEGGENDAERPEDK